MLSPHASSKERTVGIAQLAERWIVVPVVAGSIPVTHPRLQRSTSSLAATGLFALLLACNGERPPAGPAIASRGSEPPATPSVAPSVSSGPAVDPEHREASKELREFPLDGFDGKFHATMNLLEAPKLEVSKDSSGFDMIQFDASIGAPHPVSCTRKRIKLDIPDAMHGIAENLKAYDWSARSISLASVGSRVVIRAVLPVHDQASHELLAVQKMVLAVGVSGSILCNQLDEGYEQTSARAVDSLLLTATNFGDEPVRHSEIWLPEGAGVGASAWTRTLVPLNQGSFDLDVAQLHVELKDHKFRLTEVQSQSETEPSGEVVKAGQMFRDSDSDSITFAVARVGPQEYDMVGNVRGIISKTPIRTSAPLTTFFSQAPRLRVLGASPSAAPVAWVEFAGLGSSGSASLLREREARRSGEHQLVITSKDDVETCHLAPAANDPGVCDWISLKGKEAPETFRRVFVTDVP